MKKTDYYQTVKGLDEMVNAFGSYYEDRETVTGTVAHTGKPWDVNVMDLLPLAFNRDLIYKLKFEIENTGNGSTSWTFSFSKAEHGPGSLKMTPEVFWDKVSMVTEHSNNESFMTYCGRKVTAISIHF